MATSVTVTHNSTQTTVNGTTSSYNVTISVGSAAQAEYWANQAAGSAANALTSENNAATSEQNALTSANNASTSEDNINNLLIGGDAGQVLKKVSNADLDFDWLDEAGGGGVFWGTIGGTLSNQTDLQSELDDKADASDVVNLTDSQSIAGEKTFTDKVSADDLELRENPSPPASAGADAVNVFIRKAIVAGYKIVETIHLDETGEQTIINTNKITI